MDTYLVMSMDFGGSSTVSVHACTQDADSARQVYDQVHARHHAYNLTATKNGLQRFVQLIKLPANFVDADKGFEAFWGPNSEACNNGEYTL